MIWFWLWRRNKPVWFIAIPAVFMLLMPAWAMIEQIPKWVAAEQYLLVFIAAVTLLLEFWMIVEAILLWPRTKGVLEEALPPLDQAAPAVAGTSSTTSGPNC